LEEAVTAAEPTGKVSDALGQVETDLAAIWRPVDGEPPKVRASTMNLVVLAGNEIPAEVVDRVDALGTSHPARALLVAVNPRLAPWALEPDVSAICRKDPGGEVVCSERVRLVLGAVTAKRAASILGTLAISELPTVVLPLAGAQPLLADQLVATADRWIVDTRSTPIARVAQIAASARGYVADLGWAEMFPWRDLTARFFDDPSLLPMLSSIERVEVLHAPRPDGGTPPDVRLYLGWLASRLGWRLGGPDRAHAGERDVLLSIASEKGATHGAGSIRAVTLEGPIDGRRVRVHVAREAGAGGFEWRVERDGAAPSQHSFRLTVRDELWLLTHCIDASEPDRVLRAAIAAGAGWRS
jgi:hypothetical protein